MKKRKRAEKGVKLKTRLFLQVAFILVVCISVLLFLNSKYMEKLYLLYQKQSIIGMVDEINALPNIELTYYTELPAFENKNDVSIDLYNAYGEQLYVSRSTIDFSDKKVNVISRAEDGKDGGYYSILQEEGSDIQYNVYGRTLSNGYEIEITSLISPITQSEEAATSFTVLLSVVGLIFALIAVSLFAGRFTKPLEEINEITAAMARREFTRRCKIGRRDEIGELAENINHMSDSLDKALTELEEKNKQLLSDIERERKLDGIRKEFISSVSHELKTPIAIIRGYAEGLLALDKNDTGAQGEYSRIIVSEAERMNEQVLRLLEISLYESGGYQLKESTFSIGKMIDDYLAVSKPLFSEKGITAKSTVPAQLLVVGDEQKLFTVLSNYIQNGVAHADGEKQIVCRCEKNDGAVRVFVYNTGEPIAEEDADKLFMSFYRADKAHSRSEGRFGLGLSIVKAIMDVHKMACGFRNVEDGVEFWFDIKESPS